MDEVDATMSAKDTKEDGRVEEPKRAISGEDSQRLNCGSDLYWWY
jgi:hypothetical protein